MRNQLIRNHEHIANITYSPFIIYSLGPETKLGIPTLIDTEYDFQENMICYHPDTYFPILYVLPLVSLTMLCVLCTSCAGIDLPACYPQYTRQRSDAKHLGEMVFGAVAMAYGGPTCKVHTIRGEMVHRDTDRTGASGDDSEANSPLGKSIRALFLAGLLYNFIWLIFYFGEKTIWYV